MDSYKKSWVVMKSSFSEWGKDMRIQIMFLMEAVLLIRYLLGATIYGLKFNTTITPFFLPVLFSNGSISNGNLKILLYLGLIMLFSNAPFIDEKTPYLLIRSKRSSWWKGKCLYIWFSSLLYLLFIFIFSFIIVAPVASLHDLWGSILAQAVTQEGDAVVYLNNLIFPAGIIRNLYPHIAQILTFFAVWVSFAFLGHLIYAINLIASHSIVGIIVCVSLIMLAPIVQQLGWGWGTEWLYWISPINWSSIECWEIVGGSNFIPMWYGFVMPLIFIVILSVIIGFASKSKQIDVLSAY